MVTAPSLHCLVGLWGLGQASQPSLLAVGPWASYPTVSALVSLAEESEHK